MKTAVYVFPYAILVVSAIVKEELRVLLIVPIIPVSME